MRSPSHKHIDGGYSGGIMMATDLSIDAQSRLGLLYQRQLAEAESKLAQYTEAAKVEPDPARLKRVSSEITKATNKIKRLKNSIAGVTGTTLPHPT